MLFFWGPKYWRELNLRSLASYSLQPITVKLCDDEGKSNKKIHVSIFSDHQITRTSTNLPLDLRTMFSKNVFCGATSPLRPPAILLQRETEPTLPPPDARPGRAHAAYVRWAECCSRTNDREGFECTERSERERDVARVVTSRNRL